MISSTSSELLSESEGTDLNETKGYIYAVNGPVVTAKGDDCFSMLEMVYVGERNLIGEVIKISSEGAVIQVYEETSGLKVGEPVKGTRGPLSVTLGPGLIGGIFDGIERPMKQLRDCGGDFLPVGVNVPPLDTKKKWNVTIVCKPDDILSPGDVYAEVRETSAIIHKCLVPPGVSGKVLKCASDGQYTVNDTVVIIDNNGKEVKMTLCIRWPIRNPRPVGKRLDQSLPLITGQRVIDTFFPVAKGGAVAIPGGFGTGKTMTQHQLAKWADADIIVYVGCGERGNEMTQVLEEFGGLIDPRTNASLSDRTILIANTSNMPTAAREASIYTGITMAEYYRDMGYNVAMMADSTSRWAEALREISGRLEEMPAEEGFPAYLPSRIAEFYERAGAVETLGGNFGSVTVIGAVSPAGADFSEPVTQNTKRFTRCFWALDKALAYQRHYPAINWMNSYSEYVSGLSDWYSENVAPDFSAFRNRLGKILLEEDKLMEIVKLVGADVLPEAQKLIIETSRIIRVGFLQQNAFHKTDTYVPLKKQYLMMKVILRFFDRGNELASNNIPVSYLKKSGIIEKIIKMKYDIPNDDPDLLEGYITEIDNIVDGILKEQVV